MEVATLVLKEDTEGVDHKQFITEIRQQCGPVHPNYGYRTLPCVDKKKVFTVRVKEDHGQGNLIMVFGQKNVYFIAWETADRVVIFDDLQDDFKKPEKEVQERWNRVVDPDGKRNRKGQAKTAPKATPTPPGRDHPGLATADLAGLHCDYPSLCALADERDKIELGYHALRKALKALSQPIIPKGDKGHDVFLRNLAHYVLVIVLMIPECVRFNDMLDYVVEHYDTGATINDYLMGLTNKWSTLSKQVLRYPTKFDDLNENQKKVIKNLAVVLKEAEA
ncbi:hypothetical protein POM88_038832 [Heracleum sosnowskyi]|uniref:rRNA N-glycosylase n=1 Tax=Heracleum sosnowskyi TaxID=360622 RepID=A0AAD8M796_9APIA|nr:hypothetical protein POM88_038832 [Heracleum sosnowskyi]